MSKEIIELKNEVERLRVELHALVEEELSYGYDATLGEEPCFELQDVACERIEKEEEYLNAVIKLDKLLKVGEEND